MGFLLGKRLAGLSPEGTPETPFGSQNAPRWPGYGHEAAWCESRETYCGKKFLQVMERDGDMAADKTLILKAFHPYLMKYLVRSAGV
jgi:hypothetical protein